MRLPLLWPALLAATALLGACRGPQDAATLNAAIEARYPSVAVISTAELATLLQRPDGGPPMLLDVRAAEEYAVSHLAGAHLAAGPAMAFALVAGAPVDTPIVTYCSVGYRSAEVAASLQEAGYTQVRNLQGSIFRWANEGRPVYRDTLQVDVVHPYGRPWSRFLAPERRAPFTP